jgi:hypothetical protein
MEFYFVEESIMPYLVEGLAYVEKYGGTILCKYEV